MASLHPPLTDVKHSDFSFWESVARILVTDPLIQPKGLYVVDIQNFMLSLIPHNLLEALFTGDSTKINEVDHSRFEWFQPLYLRGGCPFIELCKRTLQAFQLAINETTELSPNLSRLILTVVHIAHEHLLKQPIEKQTLLFTSPYCSLTTIGELQIESGGLILLSFCTLLDSFLSAQSLPLSESISTLNIKNKAILAQITSSIPSLGVIRYLPLEEACSLFCLSSLGYQLIENSTHDDKVELIFDRLEVELKKLPLTDITRTSSSASEKVPDYCKTLVRTFFMALKAKKERLRAQTLPRAFPSGGAGEAPLRSETYTGENALLNETVLCQAFEASRTLNPLIENEKTWFAVPSRPFATLDHIFNGYHLVRGGNHVFDYFFRTLHYLEDLSSGKSTPETDVGTGELIFVRASICNHIVSSLAHAVEKTPGLLSRLLSDLSNPYVITYSVGSSEKRALRIESTFYIVENTLLTFQQCLKAVHKDCLRRRLLNPALSKTFDDCLGQTKENLKFLSSLKETKLKETKLKEMRGERFPMNLKTYPKACELCCLPSLTYHLIENNEHNDEIPKILEKLKKNLELWAKSNPPPDLPKASGYPSLQEMIEVFIESLEEKLALLERRARRPTSTLSPEEIKKREEAAAQAALELLAEEEQEKADNPPSKAKKKKKKQRKPTETLAPMRSKKEPEPSPTLHPHSPDKEPMCGAGGPLKPTLEIDGAGIQATQPRRDSASSSPSSDGFSDRSSMSMESPPPSPPLKSTKPATPKRTKSAPIPDFFKPYERHYQLVIDVLARHIPYMELDQRLWVYGSVLEEKPYLRSQSGDLDLLLCLNDSLPPDAIDQITSGFLKLLKKHNPEAPLAKVSVAYNPVHQSFALSSPTLCIDLLIIASPIPVKAMVEQKIQEELFDHKARRYNPHTGEFLKRSDKQTLAISRPIYSKESRESLSLNTLAYVIKNLAVTNRSLHKSIKGTVDFMLLCFTLTQTEEIDPGLYGLHFKALSLSFLKYREHVQALLHFCQTRQLIQRLLDAKPSEAIDLSSAKASPNPFLACCLLYRGAYTRSSLETMKRKPGLESRQNQEFINALVPHAL